MVSMKDLKLTSDRLLQPGSVENDHQRTAEAAQSSLD